MPDFKVAFWEAGLRTDAPDFPQNRGFFGISDDLIKTREDPPDPTRVMVKRKRITDFSVQEPCIKDTGFL